MERKLRSRAAVALLRTRRSRLKRIETAEDSPLRLCERTTRRPGFDRAVRVQGRAKSSSMPQMQPQRYPAACFLNDAIRRRATGLTLFSLLFFVLPVRKTREGEKGHRGEKTSFTWNWTGNLVTRTRAGERVARVGLPYFGQTDQPVSFMNIYSGWQSRAASMFSYFSNVSLVNVRKYRKMLKYIHASFVAHDQLHLLLFLITFLN